MRRKSIFFWRCHFTDSIKTYIHEERFIHTDIVFMPNLFTEATCVQLTAIQHLARIGYTYLGKISESEASGVTLAISYDSESNTYHSMAELSCFIDCFLYSEMFSKYIRQTCSGAEINNLTNEHFGNSLFVRPKENTLKSFNEKVSAIYEQDGVVEREIVRLTALRDKLLPLLMNGQISVG